MQSAQEMTAAIKALALEVGFARVGIAASGAVPGSDNLRNWLKGGYHAEMSYLTRNLSKRLQPDLLVPGARSVISLTVSYAPADDTPLLGPFVARYARQRDYHKVLERRCRSLMDRIRRIEPAFTGRAFVDSAPIMERSLAAGAGIGWIGRNGCLVVPDLGSYVVLSEIVCNLPLIPDAPIPAQCGDCDACVRACPTDAFVADALIDARKCISYLTIEHHGRIDPQLRSQIGTRIFGCDACQEPCPHNRGVPPGDPELIGAGKAPLRGATLAEILNWTPKNWDAATREAATRRASHEMFIRNAIIAAGNSGDPSLCSPLRRLRKRLGEQEELIDWALQRLLPQGPPGNDTP